ncbi:MAG: hypothetical protein ACRDGE_10775, partial [Candidatus Limnocylindria bacterium]
MRSPAAFALAAVLVAAMVGSAGHPAVAQVPAGDRVTVILAGTPRQFDPSSSNAAALVATRAEFAAWLRQNKAAAAITHEFTRLVHGVGIRLNGQSAEGLANAPGAVRVLPSIDYR